MQDSKEWGGRKTLDLRKGKEYSVFERVCINNTSGGANEGLCQMPRAGMAGKMQGNGGKGRGNRN
jgi:hypothetical protein